MQRVSFFSRHIDVERDQKSSYHSLPASVSICFIISKRKEKKKTSFTSKKKCKRNHIHYFHYTHTHTQTHTHTPNCIKLMKYFSLLFKGLLELVFNYRCGGNAPSGLFSQSLSRGGGSSPRSEGLIVVSVAGGWLMKQEADGGCWCGDVGLGGGGGAALNTQNCAKTFSDHSGPKKKGVSRISLFIKTPD